MTGQSTWLTGLLPANCTALQDASAASVSLHTTAVDASALSAALLTRWEAADVVLRFWPGAVHRVVKFCHSGYLMAGRLVICGETTSSRSAIAAASQFGEPGLAHGI